MDTFTLTSSAFASGEMIPVQYSCEGANVNPPLAVSNTPAGTTSLAIIVDDPDIPTEVKEQMEIEVFDHWITYNIAPLVKRIPENEMIGTQGMNSGGKVGYTGPCPPAKYEPTEHRYRFTIYALDAILDLPGGVTKEELLVAMEGHILATAELVGRYKMKGS